MAVPLPLVAALGSCSLGGSLPIEETFPECARDRAPEGKGDLERVFAPGPATCNDGSPPVMHVRAATDPAHADDWVLFLEGGRSCDDAAQCRERFCTSHKLMTSNLSAARERGAGLVSARADNPFAGWNVAVLHYCSSDQWLGDAEEPVELSGWLSSYTVRFEGHRVLLQLLDALDAGAKTPSGRMPRLTDARRVLFSGTSAGGAGATFHLDAVAERYPGARVVGLVDGMVDPDKEALDPEARREVELREERRWDHRYRATWDAFHREACEESGGSCQDPFFLWGTYVKTPAVLRFDVRDPVLAEVYTSNGGIPMAQFVRGVTAVGKKMAAAARPDRGAVVTDCGVHAAGGDDAFTFEMGVRADGREWRAVDAAWRLLVEEQPTYAVDGPGGQASRCPPGRREE